MATKGTEAFVSLKFSAKGLEALNTASASIKKVTSATDKSGKAMDKAKQAADKNQEATEKLQNTMRTLASSIAVIDGPLGGIASRFNAFGTTIGRVTQSALAYTAALIGISAAGNIGVKAFAEVEQRTLRLEAVLKNTGRTGEVSLESLVQAAEDLGQETLTSKEAALEALSALASFEDLPTSKLVELLALSQDLTEVLSGNIKENAVTLGKAFNDVGAAGELLKEKGLKLNDQEREYIETLVQKGQRLEAITFLQEKLSGIQGAAAAAAKGVNGVYDTLGGTLSIVSANFAKQSGIVGAVKAVVIATTQVLDFLNDNMQEIIITMRVFGTFLALNLIFSFKTWAIVIGVVTASFKILFALLLANPLVLIATAIAGIIVTIYKYRDSVLEVQGAVFSVGSFFKVVFDDIDRIISNSRDTLIVFVDDVIKITDRLRGRISGESNPLFTAVSEADFARARLNVDKYKDEVFTNLFNRAEAVEQGKGVAEAYSNSFYSNIVKNGLNGGPTDFMSIFGDKAATEATALGEEAAKRLESLADQNQKLQDQLAINAILLSGETSRVSVATLMVQQRNEELSKGKELLGISIDLQNSIEDQNELLSQKADIDSRIKGYEQQRDTLKEQLAITRLLISGQEQYASVAALRVGIDNESAEPARKILEESKSLQTVLEGENEILQRNKKEWDAVNGAVKESFSSIIKGSDTAIGALSKLLDKIADIAIESAFANVSLSSIGIGGKGGGPFDFLGSLGASLFGSAQGNAFANGSNITKYAKGGLVNSPTLFPMRGSKTGLMGEAGPEAILPLTRTSGGELGVRSIGTGSGGNSISMPVTVNVQVDSGSSTGLTDTEKARQFGNNISQAIRTEIYSVLDKESRAGGRLSNTGRAGRIS